MEKPIDKANNTLTIIKTDIEQINRMIFSIKADIETIKLYINKKREADKEKERLKNTGWFY